MDWVPAGNVVGIAGLEQCVLKSATLSSTLSCPAFRPMSFIATPIVRVAVEPVHPSEMPALVRGMKLLNMADPCVEVMVQGTGEHVLGTAGEVHLQRCMDDLTRVFARVELRVSQPIIPFRETVVTPPTVDMTNVIIPSEEGVARGSVGVHPGEGRDGSVPPPEGLVQTANKVHTLLVRATPLPLEVTQLLEANAHLLKALSVLSSGLSRETAVERREMGEEAVERREMRGEGVERREMGDEAVERREMRGEGVERREMGDEAVERREMGGEGVERREMGEEAVERREMGGEGVERREMGDEAVAKLNAETLRQLQELREKLRAAFEGSPDYPCDAVDRIWSFGPRGVGPNVLLNCVPTYQRPSVWSSMDCAAIKGVTREHDTSIVNGFQLATLSGPLCEEPMYGVCVSLQQWTQAPPLQTISPIASEGVSSSSSLSDTYGPVSGQLMSAMKEGCRRAFLAQPVRLMAAMYSCSVLATSEVLGRLYGVLGRRGGKVCSEEVKEGTTLFNVRALLPVAESFGFAEEMRKKTSGLASPQLVFSHWEVCGEGRFSHWVVEGGSHGVVEG